MSGRIALGTGTAGLLVMVAFGVWAAAIVASAGDTCPGTVGPGGGFEAISAWPPGLRCGEGASQTVSQALPWASPVIGGLFALAGSLVMLAIGTEIRALRRHVPTRRDLAQADLPEPVAVPLLALASGEEPGVAEPQVPLERAA